MPVYNPALDDILDLSDKTASGRLALAGSRVVAATSSRTPRLMRNSSGAARVRACLPSQSGNAGFDDVDLSTAVVREAIGVPDKVPDTGTFPLAPIDPQTVGPLIVGKRYFIAAFVAGDDFINAGATLNATGNMFVATAANPTNWTHASALQEITTDLDVAAAYSDFAAALNLTAALIALGGVTVTNPSPGAYRVAFNAFGPQTAIAGPVNAGLTPLSVISVSSVQAGTSTLHEVQLIRLIAVPYCFATLSTPFPAATAVITEIQTATQDLPEIKRLTLDPIPYAGIFIVGLDDTPEIQVPYNATAAQLSALAGPKYVVNKRADNAWEFAGADPAQAVVLTCDVAGLIVPVGVTGVMALNTDGMAQAFANTTAKWIKLTREIDIQFPGEDPLKVLVEDIEVWRDLIDLGAIVPAVMPGLQFVASNYLGTPFKYDSTITALTGGSEFCLDFVDLTTLAVSSLYFIYVNGLVQEWLVKAGDADPTDPAGQVHWIGYNSGAPATNKHFEKGG